MMWRFDTTDDELYDLSLSVGTRRHGPWPTVSRMEMTVGNPSYSRVSYGSPDYGGFGQSKNASCEDGEGRYLSQVKRPAQHLLPNTIRLGAGWPFGRCCLVGSTDSCHQSAYDRKRSGFGLHVHLHGHFPTSEAKKSNHYSHSRVIT